MKIVLYILAVLCFLGGLLSNLMATTVFQQIAAGMYFVVAAVLMSGAAIIGAIERLEKKNASSANRVSLPEEKGEIKK